MLKEDEEAINVTAHRDLVLLIKEYARKGYEQAQGSNDNGFEALWYEAFHTNGSEPLPTAPETLVSELTRT